MFQRPSAWLWLGLRLVVAWFIDDAFCLTLTDDGSLHPVAKHSRGAPPRASKAAMWKRRPVISCMTKRAQMGRL